MHVENSYEGTVNVTLSKILGVYSHPHALTQCRDWITKHYPDIDLIPVSSTAEAAKKVAKEDFAAAIASEAAAKIYDLCILQKGIQNSRENFTKQTIKQEILKTQK